MKKIILVLIGICLAYNVNAANPQYGYNMNNIRWVGTTNNNALQTHNEINTEINTNKLAITTSEKSYNGGNVIIAGVSGMSTYTPGGKVILYETESNSNVYKGRIDILGDKHFVFTAIKNNDDTWTKTEEVFDKNWKPSTSTIQAKIQTITELKDKIFEFSNEKNEEGYFQKINVNGNEYKAQTGDVVKANVNGDTLTIDVNGQKTEFKTSSKDTNTITNVNVKGDLEITESYDSTNDTKSYVIDSSKIDNKIKTETKERIEKDNELNERIIENQERIIAETNRAISVENDLGTKITNVNNRLDNIDNTLVNHQYQLNKLNRKVIRGLSSVTALTALVPNARSCKDNQIAMGVGYYEGHNSLAIGGFHYINDDIMLNAGVGYGGKNSFAAKAGITMGF